MSAIRLPARLTAEQSARILGFQPHDIPVLVKCDLLKPLGGGPKNCVKFFAACEVEVLREDRKWLDRATKAVSRRAQPIGKSTNITNGYPGKFKEVNL
jgi:hypothetical protein